MSATREFETVAGRGKAHSATGVICRPLRGALMIGAALTLTLGAARADGPRGIEDSTLFSGFVDVVEADFRPLTFTDPNVGPALDASFNNVREAAQELNANFEVFDGDEVIQFIDDLARTETQLKEFWETLAGASLSSPLQEAARAGILARINGKLVHLAATRAVADTIRDRFRLIRIDTEDYSLGSGNRVVGDINLYMADLHDLIAAADYIFGPEETEDVIAAVLEEARTGVHLLGRLEAAKYLVDRNLARSLQLQQMGGARRALARPPTAVRGPSAGSFSNVEVALDTFGTAFDDDREDLSGDEYGESAFVSADLGDRLTLGLGLSSSVYRIDGPVAFERTSTDVESYANWHLSPRWTAGVFLGYSSVDIEDATLTILGQPVSVGDAYGRWQAGALVSFDVPAGPVDMGITTSLSSGNRAALDDVFTTHDSAWATLLDVTRAWTDAFSTTAYATYYTTLRNTTADDGSYWIVGGECTYAFSDRLSVTVGYETTLAYGQYEDHTGRLGLSWQW